MYTDKLYTGQREIAGLGIYHYGARFREAPPKRSAGGYSPKLGRFLNADSMVPNMANPQALNRYSYVYGNPIRYIDPTGHVCADPDAPNRTCESGNPYPNNTQSLPSAPVVITNPDPLDDGIRQRRPRVYDPIGVDEPQESTTTTLVTVIPDGFGLDDAIKDFQDALGEGLRITWAEPVMDTTQIIIDEVVNPILGLSEPTQFTTSVTEAGLDLIDLGLNACNTPGVSCGDLYQKARLVDPSLRAINPITIDGALLTICIIIPGCIPP